jgi:polysaccharide biosynthesis/export protein
LAIFSDLNFFQTLEFYPKVMMRISLVTLCTLGTLAIPALTRSTPTTTGFQSAAIAPENPSVQPKPAAIQAEPTPEARVNPNLPLRVPLAPLSNTSPTNPFLDLVQPPAPFEASQQPQSPESPLPLFPEPSDSKETPSAVEAPPPPQPKTTRLLAFLPGSGEDYRLGAGDRIKIDFLNFPEYAGETQVLVDGSVNLPLVGKVDLANLTLEQASAALQNAYAYYVQRPSITVSLLVPRPIHLAVSGEVNSPGTYTISLSETAQFPTVTTAIEQAGGITQAADLRRVTVTRTSPGGSVQVMTVNLWALLQGNDLSQDISLRDGDTLSIPTASRVNPAESSQVAGASFAAKYTQPMNVVVVGEVARPGSYTVEVNNAGEQPRLTRALEVAGGVMTTANISQIQVQRFTRSGQTQTLNIDLWKLLQNGDRNQDPILQPGDTIIIPTATTIDIAQAQNLATASFAAQYTQPMNVVVVGEVASPGAYTVEVNNGGEQPRLTRALEVAGGVTPTANISQILVQRFTRNGQIQTLNVDLWKLLQNGDRNQDLILQPGDTIMIPTATEINTAQAQNLAAASFAAELTQPLNIAVVGEVARPGPHIVNGETDASGNPSFPTVTRAIQVAGGITQLADVREITVRRLTREGTERIINVDLWKLLQGGDLQQDAILQSGDTIIIPTATAMTPEETAEIASASFSPDAMPINVVGEVGQPGTVQVPPNTPLNQAIMAAGGFTNRAKKGEVELVRLNPDGTVERREIDVDLGAGIDEENNPSLRPNDVILVGRSTFTAVTDTVGQLLPPFSILRILNIFK